MADGNRLSVKGQWTRSGKYECCQSCGTTERRHMARGFCARCYDNVMYHENIEREKAQRKARRIGKDLYEKERPRVQEWVRNNRDRNAAVKAEWHRRTYEYRFQLGDVVWTEYCGFMCRGKVVELRSRRSGGTIAVVVQLDGGTRLPVFGVKRWKLLHKTNPSETLEVVHA
jgi:hypothetical protein